MIKKFVFVFMFIFIVPQAHARQKPSYHAAVAPSFIDGRLGNSLWNYCHAKWVAHKTGLPFFYREFHYYTSFSFSKEEKNLKFSKGRPVKVNGTNYKDLANRYKDRNVLLIVPFGFSEKQWKSPSDIIKAYRKNIPFAQELKKKLKPIKMIPLIPKPADRASVAIHIRKGGGFDVNTDVIHKKYPLKFPPNSFYIEQLIKLSYMLNHAPMYVYIFTDDPDPKKICQEFQNTVNLPNVIFDYRKEANAHNLNVIEDLFNLAHFEYLIRPDSSYTRVAEVIGEHKLTIYPTEAHLGKKYEDFYISQVGVSIYDRNLEAHRSKLSKPLFKRPTKKGIYSFAAN